MKTTIETGKEGQFLAAKFLESAGYSIVAENFRHGMTGEIDIVAEKGALCLFVEVKNRNNPLYGAELSINSNKIAHLKRTAIVFLMRHPEIAATMCRFDLISVVDGEIEWHQDIFR